VEYLFPKEAYNEVISPLSSYQLKCTFKQCPPKKRDFTVFFQLWGDDYLGFHHEHSMAGKSQKNKLDEVLLGKSWN